MCVIPDGWGVSIAGYKRGDQQAFPGHDPNANSLVVGAIQNLSKGGADDVPIETRQEIARIAEEAFKKKESKEGRIGDVQYKVGCYRFKNDPRGYDSKGDNIARQLKLEVEYDWMPFVAIRLVKK